MIKKIIFLESFQTRKYFFFNPNQHKRDMRSKSLEEFLALKLPLQTTGRFSRKADEQKENDENFIICSNPHKKGTVAVRVILENVMKRGSFQLSMKLIFSDVITTTFKQSQLSTRKILS